MNAEEADRVRAIFQRYLDRGLLLAVTEELNRRGWTTKSWTMRNGLLRNPVYIGKVKLKGEVLGDLHLSERRIRGSPVCDGLKSAAPASRDRSSQRRRPRIAL